ncbi:TonB-dependent receptor [Sphingopyxis yananensis]|uniref:TonB-dependent receptor n=1 Tax=Sphingopyxis yananensis TaxID=2886687 RepID=UPI001D10F542|nr:TonB-dependent receptor [Sphingopyxis yananensis]MCC2602371.1 TonB-dependent receptor [Sphingopyxis yananensis]
MTAQKRSERLQDVPISISAVTSDTLQKQSVMQVSQLSLAVPAVRIDFSGNTVQPTIRGVGSAIAGPGTNSNIPTYIDGYYIPNPVATDLALINIAGLSVLKGPQGTLFGRNATGGAIQVTTKAPQHDTNILARLSYASFNHITAGVYGSTGLTPNLAIDLAASYEYGDGFKRNIVTGQRNVGQFSRWSVRSKALWEPTDGVIFTLAYGHTYSDDPTPNMVNARNGMSAGALIPGNVVASGRRDMSNGSPNYDYLTTDAVTLTSNFDLGFADLTSYTAYRKESDDQGFDYDASPAFIQAAKWTIPEKTFTQEINLTSKGGGRFNWVLGAFYLYNSSEYHYNIAAGSNDYSRLFDSRNKTNSYAVFADGTYEVMDKLFVTVGGRYSIDKPHVAFNLMDTVIDEGGATFKNFSPRAVVRYEINRGSSVYGSFTKGYKSGILPAASFSTVAVEPESIDAFELGYKISQGPLRFNLAGFYYDYKDVQVASFFAQGVSVVRNAASAEIYGVDGELSYDVTPDFTLSASAAYTHADYKKFQNAIGYEQDLDPSSQTYSTFQPVNVDASGFQVLRSPRLAFNVGANYGFNLANGRMALNANYYRTSKFYFDAVEQFGQKAYGLLNLRATWTDPSERMDVSIFGTNVTNTNYITQTLPDTVAIRQAYGEPAAFGAALTFRY